MNQCSNSQLHRCDSPPKQSSGPSDTNAGERGSSSHDKRVSWCLAVILSLAGVLYLAMLTTDRFGAYYDDGQYVVAAKALATGRGYRIISLPSEQPQTLIPPLYPFLLSLVWRIDPHFPQNLTGMMLLSLTMMLTFLYLAYLYLFKNGYATRWQALIVVALAAINWRTMLLAASIMSDVTFAAMSIGALHIAERYEKEQRGRMTGVAMGIAMGLVFLTRTSGIAVLIAVVVYFTLRRQRRKALLPVVIASLFVVGWVSWAYLNQSSGVGANAVYYSTYMHGLNHAVSDLQALNETSRLATLLGIVGTNILMLLVGSVPLACLGLRHDLPTTILVAFVLFTLILIVAGAVRQFRTGFRLQYVYLPIYLALHLIAPGSAYDRYIIPIVPFLLLFLISELSRPLLQLRRELISHRLNIRALAALPVSLVLLIYTGGACYNNASGIYDTLQSIGRSAARGGENAEVMDWIKAHTATSDVVLCNSDPVIYLFTGRKAVLSFPLVLLNTIPYQTRELTFDEQAKAFLEIVDESHAAYFLIGSSDFRHQSELYRTTIEVLIQQESRKFIPVFRSTNGNNIVYRIEVGDG